MRIETDVVALYIFLYKFDMAGDSALKFKGFQQRNRSGAFASNLENADGSHHHQVIRKGRGMDDTT